MNKYIYAVVYSLLLSLFSCRLILCYFQLNFHVCHMFVCSVVCTLLTQISNFHVCLRQAKFVRIKSSGEVFFHYRAKVCQLQKLRPGIQVLDKKISNSAQLLN